MTVSALAADTPATEDLLGFTPHAQRLAATILQGLPEGQSFVIGIEGEWGEGKSSFINFLKHRLNAPEAREVQPAIVEFNPWWYEGSDKLLSHLLETLIHQLNAMEALDKEFKQALIQFFKALDGAAPVIEKTSKAWLPLLGVVATGAAAAQYQWLGAVLGVLVSVLAKLGLEHVQKTPSLEDLRCKLVTKPGYLTHANQKVVVIIDDLDRLPRDEIQQLFRVIKGVLNLPNIVYVIAYDRKIVASALSDFHKDSGEAYLEKIIQLPFRLPKPTQAQFLAYNTKLLVGFWIDGAPVLPDNGEEYAALALIVKAFLPKPRDVKRLLVTLLVSHAIPDEIRMDRLDFIFLEAMRLKNQALWQAMLRAWLDCERYAAMDQVDWRNYVAEEGEPASPDCRNWVTSHFGSLEIREPALLSVMRCFTGLPFTSDQESMTRHQPARGLNQFGMAERSDDLKELAVSYLQSVLPESALSQREIEKFVLADTAEQVAIAIDSCVFPQRLLQAAGDFFRTELIQQRMKLSQLEAHFTAVAEYMDKHLNLALRDGDNKYVRSAWIFSGWFATVEQYILDGLLFVEPEQKQNRRLAGRAEALFLSWLSPEIAPRTVAEFVFLSNKSFYESLEARVAGYFVELPLGEFLKSAAAAKVLQVMARSEGGMSTYRRIWLEKLPSPAAISDQEKELLGRMVTNWNPEIFQNWLFEAKPFTALVETVRDSGFNEEITEGCQQFLVRAGQLTVASRP